MLRYPDFFIVGAPKAGTTSLYAHLRRHPNVYLPAFKEPHYFSELDLPPEFSPFLPHIEDEEEYLGLFSDADVDQLIGDASTSYLGSAIALKNIQDKVPDARIIVMLRAPVARAYSHFLNNVREGIEKRGFRAAVLEDLTLPDRRWGHALLYVDLGMYPKFVQSYQRALGKERVLIVYFEDYVRDARQEVHRVTDFLGLSPASCREDGVLNKNPFGVPRNSLASAALSRGWLRSFVRQTVPRQIRRFVRSRFLFKQAAKPAMDPFIRLRLQEMYEGMIDDLTGLVGRRPPWSPDLLQAGSECE